MSDKSKKTTGFQKKHLLLIIIGVLLVFVIGLTLGFFYTTAQYSLVRLIDGSIEIMQNYNFTEC